MRTYFAAVIIAAFLALEAGAWGQGPSWVAKTPLPEARSAMAAGSIDGRIYVAGGEFCLPEGLCSTVFVYDSAANTWSLASPLLQTRKGAAGAVVDGIFYVVGGRASNRVLASVEAYNPSTNTWTARASMPTPRHELAVVVVDGILYALGGLRSIPTLLPAFPLATVEAYDPKTDTWTTKAPIPTPRPGLAATAADGIIYTMGGRYGFLFWVPSSVVEAYDPQTNTWSSRALMPGPRSHLAAATLDGNIYAVGGRDWPQDTVSVYNPATNSWTAAPSLPTRRYNASAVVADDILYVIGGDQTSRVAANEAFSRYLAVGIDIRPGDSRNTLNLKSSGTVPVAVLSTATFSASTVDVSSVRFAGAPVAANNNGNAQSSYSDVNGDGYIDLLLHFRTQQLQLAPNDTRAVLIAGTFSGQRIRGADSVTILH